MVRPSRRNIIPWQPRSRSGSAGQEAGLSFKGELDVDDVYGGQKPSIVKADDPIADTEDRHQLNETDTTTRSQRDVYQRRVELASASSPAEDTASLRAGAEAVVNGRAPQVPPAGRLASGVSTSEVPYDVSSAVDGSLDNFGAVRADEGGGVTDEELTNWVDRYEETVPKDTNGSAANHPVNQLRNMYAGLVAKMTNAQTGAEHRMSFHSGSGPVPAQSTKRAAYIAQMNNSRFTVADARALQNVADALGVPNPAASMLGPTRTDKDRLTAFAAKSNALTARHDRGREMEEEYKRWGGKERYETAQRLNAFYKANKSQWSDIVKVMTDNGMSLDEFDAMGRLDKQAFVLNAYQTLGEGGLLGDDGVYDQKKLKKKVKRAGVDWSLPGGSEGQWGHILDATRTVKSWGFR